METSLSLIEKLDKSRYNLIKWFTVGWAIWFGTNIIKDAIENIFLLGILILIGLLGWIMWSVNLIRFYRLGKIVNADLDLKHALNDELQKHNSTKSLVTGFSTTVFTVVVFIVLASFLTIPTLMALKIVLYISVLSTLIASLLYNRS